MSLLSSTQGTPERVWSALRIVEAEGGRIKRQDLWTWLNPPFRVGGQPRPLTGEADRQTVNAAASLELLIGDGADYSLGAPGSLTYQGYADVVHDRLCGLTPEHADYILLEAFAWSALAADDWGTLWTGASDFADRVEAALGDPQAGDARRFNSTKQTPWRRWMCFLGLGVDLPGRQGFHAHVTQRVDLELRRAELPLDVALPIHEVLDVLGRRMPYLDRGVLRAEVAARSGKNDDRDRLSLLLSTALRELHDEGRLELDRRGDAAGYVDLAPDPFHDVKSVLTLTLKTPADD